MKNYVKITFTPFYDCEEFKAVSYYILNDEQYDAIMKFYNDNFQEHIGTDNWVTKHNMIIEHLEHDPIIQKFIEKYKNPCNILENMDNFKITNFFDNNFTSKKYSKQLSCLGSDCSNDSSSDSDNS